MMTFTNEEWNSENVLAGIQAYRGRRNGGLRVTDDISDVDFQINTNNALRFLAGYIANALDRIEALEAQIAAHEPSAGDAATGA